MYVVCTEYDRETPEELTHVSQCLVQWSGLYTLCPEKSCCHYIFAANFAKHWLIFKIVSSTDLAVSCSKALMKYPTTPQMCRYITLWNINVRKTTTWNSYSWKSAGVICWVVDHGTREQQSPVRCRQTTFSDTCLHWHVTSLAFWHWQMPVHCLRWLINDWICINLLWCWLIDMMLFSVGHYLYYFLKFYYIVFYIN